MKKSLKEGINETEIGRSSDGNFTLWLSDCRSANHGKDPHFEILLGINGYFSYSVRTEYEECEEIVNKWIKKYNIVVDKKELNYVLSMKESKKENKTMKKSIKERFEEPRNWDFGEMAEKYGNEYLQENDSDNEIFDMGMFDEICDGYTPTEIVQRCVFGGRYGYKNDSFNINDEYFKFNGYANFESITKYDYVECLTDHIDESYFYDWCVDNGYFEPEDED